MRLTDRLLRCSLCWEAPLLLPLGLVLLVELGDYHWYPPGYLPGWMMPTLGVLTTVGALLFCWASLREKNRRPLPAALRVLAWCFGPAALAASLLVLRFLAVYLPLQP